MINLISIFKEPSDKFLAERPVVADDQCHRCQHYNRGTTTCRAFPNGIPVGFLMAEFDHTQPYEGDNGIRFKPL